MNHTETVTIETSGKIRLAGIIHNPIGRVASLGTVVAHGMLSFKGSDKHRLICEALAEAGIAALRFDFRGRGESDGESSDLTVSNEIEDLGAALSFLRHRGLHRVAAVGSSLGGTVALLAGVRDRGIESLVTIAAPARLPDGPRQAWGGSGRTGANGLIEVAPGEFIDREFFIDAGMHDVIAAARSIDCPWLIIHGAADEVVPVEDAGLLQEAAPSAALKIHPTASHRFDKPGERGWVVSTVAGFVSDLS